MIYLLIKNHKQDYSLNNLIKVFFPDFEINIIKEIKDYPSGGLLFESILDNSQLVALTNLYIDGYLSNSIEEKIDHINISGETMEKKTRLAIRKSMYSALESISQLNSPWGILTGVRPMKIVHDLINKDLEVEEISNILSKDYKLHLSKITLMMNIAKIQRDYIYPVKDEYSLYISIPFCPSRCYYCSFPSLLVTSYENQIEKYIEKLIYEINSTSEMMKDYTINTVYIGGGTPTAIGEKYLEQVIQALYLNFGKDNIREFTVEAGRPDTINRSYLEMLRRNGIKRISINPQTMNPKTLEQIGRKHGVEDIINTYKMAKEMEFDPINMDLIIGLPGEDESHIKNTIEEISKLGPENLTVHTLSLKTGSNLKGSSIDYSLKRQNSLRKMLDHTYKYAEGAKLYPYYLYRQKRILANLENIGFAKEGKECVYNIVMMEEKQTIIGLGMGAVSKIYNKREDKIMRLANFKSLNEYINRLDDLILRKKRSVENSK